MKLVGRNGIGWVGGVSVKDGRRAHPRGPMRDGRVEGRLVLRVERVQTRKEDACRCGGERGDGRR
jgi:hypothetical protein